MLAHVMGLNRWGIGVLGVVAALAACPTATLANMADPSVVARGYQGDPVSEPSGALLSVAILHEDLDIDLRPLQDDNPARISATYQVSNQAEAAQLTLMFVAPALAGAQSEVLLDGSPVPSSRGTARDLPDSWQPPKTTPALGSGEAIPYVVQGLTTDPVRASNELSFTLDLSPGAHAIQVSYAARATAVTKEESPVRFWQLGYVLAPARQWASFGGLDASVDLAPGWQAASDPPLARAGDQLRGSFGQIPADALAITAQAPVPPSPPDLAWPVFAAGLVLALVVGTATGRRLRRRGRTAIHALPMAAVIGLVCAVTVGYVQGFGPDIPQTQATWSYGYDAVFEAIGIRLLLVPVMLIGLIATQIAAARSARRIPE